MTLSLAVVCEAAADQHTGCDLADRVVCADVDWIEDGRLPDHRAWRGFTPVGPFLRWTQVDDLARARRIKAHGHFDGQPGAPDAHVARLALLLFIAADPRPDAVVLLRDDDGQKERGDGLEQARSTSKLGVPIIIGLARPKRECWVLAGFEPADHNEAASLLRLTQELHFDPRESAQNLTAKHANQKRDAKSVLRALTGGDWQREADCWKNTDLALLEKRGQNTGLADYLKEVRQKLVPLFTGHTKSP